MQSRFNQLLRDGCPAHLAARSACLCKNDSNSQVQETQETHVTTNTTTNEFDQSTNFTDNADLSVDAPESTQTGVIKLSNVEAGSAVDLQITNSGLGGDDLQKLIEPVTGVLEKISRDSGTLLSNISRDATEAIDVLSRDAARTHSTIGALTTTVGETFDTAGDTLTSLGDATQSALTNLGDNVVSGAGDLVAGLSETAQDFAGKAKDVLKHPGVQISAGAVALLLLNRKRGKKK